MQENSVIDKKVLPIDLYYCTSALGLFDPN